MQRRVSLARTLAYPSEPLFIGKAFITLLSSYAQAKIRIGFRPYPIEIAPYGYSAVSLCSFLPAAVRIVSGPTLPINIRKINISLPATLNCAVIPVESPTVAKAETVSNAIGKNGSDSVTVNTNMAADTIVKPKPRIRNAFFTCSSGIDIFLMMTVRSFFKNERKNAKTTATVFNLIPPAVLPEAPPTNITKIIINSVALVSEAKDTVEKPAVRSVTA